ncbi:aminodeoxychorismate synthase component I [Reinekea marinisedimentorum]|uniref:aminodeoxychorismate synthase component I n=1 Tax=Reinekea marinisedimentorum TaxID=230495 RepID=UPI002436C8EA|nr:aminodeoxychorismate synthase component I [Reinekea marinisedimentorum]
MQLPYLRQPQLLINQIKDASGLIWFHEGGKQGQCEWFSAWPDRNFEYLGNHQTRVTDVHGQQQMVSGDFIELLKATVCQSTASAKPGFTSGLAGHFSYDFGLERLNVHSKFTATNTPLAVVGNYRWSCYTNHHEQKTTLYIQDDCAAEVQQRIISLADNAKQASLSNANASKPVVGEWQSQMSKTAYSKSFQAIQNYLVEGDIYQANLTRQWLSQSDDTDWQLYSALVAAMPAPFSVFHRCATLSLLSVSPERFIEIKNRKITTQPIKGTRPRGDTPEQDSTLRTELQNSEKDQAENLMIVDLLRNDIAKNATPGSVKVERLFEIQSFRNVHHLVSTITAELQEGSHPLDVLADAFPGGSITGAPKKRAMQIIDELETVRRGAYCGSAFYLSDNGDLDSNILIRTLTQQADKLSCHGGGGIVIDSKEDEEYEESAIKVSRILKALRPH